MSEILVTEIDFVALTRRSTGSGHVELPTMITPVIVTRARDLVEELKKQSGRRKRRGNALATETRTVSEAILEHRSSENVEFVQLDNGVTTTWATSSARMPPNVSASFSSFVVTKDLGKQ